MGFGEETTEVKRRHVLPRLPGISVVYGSDLDRRAKVVKG